MKAQDWLLMLYIFKWGHVWQAPWWVFLFFWTVSILALLVAIIKEARK